MELDERIRTERARRGITQVLASVEAKVSILSFGNMEKGLRPGPRMQEKIERWLEESTKKEGWK